MNKNNKLIRVSAIVASVVSAAAVADASAFTSKVGGTGKVANVPRGANVGALAGNCGIGPFNQSSKAGPYNALCAVMQDSEKCLGLIKQAFYQSTEEEVKVSPLYDVEKGRYCLEVLRRDLGLE